VRDAAAKGFHHEASAEGHARPQEPGRTRRCRLRPRHNADRPASPPPCGTGTTHAALRLFYYENSPRGRPADRPGHFSAMTAQGNRVKGDLGKVRIQARPLVAFPNPGVRLDDRKEPATPFTRFPCMAARPRPLANSVATSLRRHQTHLRPKHGRLPVQPLRRPSLTPRAPVSHVAKRDAGETPSVANRVAPRAPLSVEWQAARPAPAPAVSHAMRPSLPCRETRR